MKQWNEAVKLDNVPVLDPGFIPAVMWNRLFSERVAEDGGSEPLAIALKRDDGSVFVRKTRILSHEGSNRCINERYTERLLKFLLWQKGAPTIVIGGNPAIADALRAIYSSDGARAFDYEHLSDGAFRKTLSFESCDVTAVPAEKLVTAPLGRHLEGCRIGFDLGGSDRKCAALIDGKVVFSDEVAWSPYFEHDPEYHRSGIRDSLQRAAAHLPRVDAIGGSAAGIYLNNEVRIGSLYRGLDKADFDQHIRRMFFELQEEWGGVPFEVVNDGEVTALAGAMSMNANAVLGVAMGTSLAAGYVTPEGNITNWLNELAFVPVDYREGAPVDEWSGDAGCGVNYFSQQAVGRLAEAAGIELPKEMPLPEKLCAVQKRLQAGDERAARIYETIGCYLGYTVAHFSEFYTIENMLILGRVMTGEGGSIILREADRLLNDVFPELASKMELRTPSEKDKRHGQAVAAASLAALREKEPS
ncbi:MAG: ROK family protein [Lentisphaerae bacterium]|nr:ROK family protein [Lentisphaerota bacterium]